MPGFGVVLTFTLIALLPELGKMSRKQIAVLRLEGTTFHIWRLTRGASSLPKSDRIEIQQSGFDYRRSARRVWKRDKQYNA
jgi:hypothetical protein